MQEFRLAILLLFVSICLGRNVHQKDVLALESRVVNGDLANLGEFPYLASLQYFEGHRCSCTILNNEWVLTAARCIYGHDLSLGRFQVRAGSNNYCNGGSVHRVVDGEYHSGYINSAYRPNDIAVLRVDPPFVYGATLLPTVLANAGSDVPNGWPTIIAGWGASYYQGPYVDELLKATVVTYSDAECLTQYGGSGPTAKTICAGGGGKGTCHGDYGGPLMDNRVQVGVNSWTREPCAEIAAVWTQVSYYRDWIFERTGA